MLSIVVSHAPIGLDGVVIRVEVDIRRGIPGIDIVGLPDGAVRESRERVRVAIRNSGFTFPPDRILVNLSPAGMRKVGASYDLPIALGILTASGQIPKSGKTKMMVLGELNLTGAVRPVNGVLSAVASGLRERTDLFLVPQNNIPEARALQSGRVFGISSLNEAAKLLIALARGEAIPMAHSSHSLHSPPSEKKNTAGDFAEIKGHTDLKRSLEIASAGGHHLLLFGPPGSGKTMAARRLPSILPALTRSDALVVTQIHSIAGLLPPASSLISRPPFRAPHHSASAEGVIGGGKIPGPGEVSLAHAGILFLDEAPEFKAPLLQSLREPLEMEQVHISRAGVAVQFPSRFQLVCAVNPCPCGNLGKPHGVCLCDPPEIKRYWRKIGGALLDRIDIRVPCVPASPEEMMSPSFEGSVEVRRRVQRAAALQTKRYRGFPFRQNARIPPGLVDQFCAIDSSGAEVLRDSVDSLSLSSRAYHSIIKVARTIADLEACGAIRKVHILEAIQLRRYGEGDLFWSYE